MDTYNTFPMPSGPRSPTMECVSLTPNAISLDVPEFTGDHLTFDFTGMPDVRTFADVGPPPDVVMPELPGSFSYDEPALPSVDVEIPEFALLDPIDVSVNIPSLDLGELDADIEWEEDAFNGETLQAIQGELDRVRQGDFSITAAIWDQIWNRAVEKVHREGLTRRRQASATWANRGWSLPGGAAFAAEQQATQDIYEQTSRLASEIAVQEAEHKDKQFWQAVSEGVKIEAQLADINHKKNERALRVAIAVHEAAVAIYRAAIDAYNVEVQKANIEVARVGAEIQAQNAILEGQKLQLDAARIRGDLKKVEVEAYVSQWQGVQSAAQAYTAEIEGIRAKVEVQKAAVEAYGTRVQAKKTDVEAYGVEWQNYKTKTDAQRLKVDYYGQLVNQYSARINAYDAQVRGLEAGERSKGALAQAAAACMTAEAQWDKNYVDEVLGHLQHDAAKIAAHADRYSSDQRLAGTTYSSDRQFEGTTYSSDRQLEGTHYSSDKSYWATTTAACTSARAQVTVGNAENQTRVTIANLDQGERLAIANAENATRVSIANAQNAVQMAVAEAQGHAQITSAEISAQAQLGAAVTNSYHYSFSNSKSWSEGESVSNNTYNNTTESCNTNKTQNESSNSNNTTNNIRNYLADC